MPCPWLLAAGDLGGSLIVDLAAVLVAAAAVALLMQRMRLAVVPGFLIAGVVLGPGMLGVVRQESLESISSLAIILLMFGIGLQLHLSVLRHNLFRMVVAGVGSCGISVLVGWPVAMWFGFEAPAAIAVAMALSLSSTAVVLRIISERRELHHTTGRLALSILVIQDLLVLLMLAALPALARWAGTAERPVGEPPQAFAGDNWLEFAANASIRIAGIAALIVFGRLILPRILLESARGRATDILMLVSVAAAIAAAMVTDMLGFSLELGAFLAGFLLAGTPFRHHLIGQVGPLRDLFIAVFFTAVGMELRPAALLDGWWIILLGGAVMSILKGIIIGGTAWSMGASAAVAAAVGFALAQAGEFSLVLLDRAGPGEGSLNLISAEAHANTIAIVVVSLIITPGLVAIGRHAGTWLGWVPPAPWFRRSMLGGGERLKRKAAAEETASVVIGGYGPVGRRIVEMLERQGVRTTVIELNPVTVSLETKRGRAILYGDVSNEEVLRSAGIEHALALVLTIPDEEAALRACAVAKRISPDVFMVVRTTTAGQASLAEALGAEHVVADEQATAEVMQRTVIEHCGAGMRRAPEKKR